MSIHGETVLQYKLFSAIRTDDVWTGLFTQPPFTYPKLWEADCSVQPDSLGFWGDKEPDNTGTDLCARFKLSPQGLFTWNCKSPYSIVCEFDKGSLNLHDKQALSNEKTEQLLILLPQTTKRNFPGKLDYVHWVEVYEIFVACLLFYWNIFFFLVYLLEWCLQWAWRMSFCVVCKEFSIVISWKTR